MDLYRQANSIALFSQKFPLDALDERDAYVKEKLDFTHNHYAKFFKHYYGGLFTDEDIQMMLYGKDKWFNKEDMEKLLKKNK